MPFNYIFWRKGGGVGKEVTCKKRIENDFNSNKSIVYLFTHINNDTPNAVGMGVGKK